MMLQTEVPSKFTKIQYKTKHSTKYTYTYTNEEKKQIMDRYTSFLF